MSDNCLKEFTYATRMRKKIVAVVLEECMMDQSKWKGIVGA